MSDDPALLKEPRVYALADMFFLQDLKTVATVKLKEKLSNLWTDDSFPDCIREIYANTPESDNVMRPAVVEVAKAHVQVLATKNEFKDLIREGGDFALQCFESIVSLVPPAVSAARQTNMYKANMSRAAFDQWS